MVLAAHRRDSPAGHRVARRGGREAAGQGGDQGALIKPHGAVNQTRFASVVSRTMIAARGFLAVLGLSLMIGCKDSSKATPKATPDVAAPGDGAAPSGGSATAPAKPMALAPLDAATAKSDAQAFLTRWVAVQNSRDFAGYSAMYDPKSFRGVKRTHGGKVKKFGAAGWLGDRKRMFDKGFEVAVENVTIDSWLDAGSKLKPGVASLRFLQRWKGGGYADHGIKVLQLWRDAVGTWHIVYEDLLNSELGWDRSVQAITGIELVAPADDAAAMELWKKLAPTGADYQNKLAAISDDASVARPMARAMLKAGGFECKKTVDTGNCGEEILEFAPIDEDTGLDDPCLRRRLAEWALEHVNRSDVAGLRDTLLDLVKLDVPESELTNGAFTAVPNGDDELRLTLMAAALESGHESEAEEQVEHLVGEAAIVRAASELGLDAAVTRLDPKKHRATRLAALGDDRLTVETREVLVDAFDQDRRADVAAALISMRGASDCGLAMRAALLLADRGDKSALPRWSATGTADDLLRALCLIANDPDADRQNKRFREFLAAKVIDRTHDRDMDSDEVDPKGKKVNRNAPSGTIREPGNDGVLVESWETVRRGDLELQLERFTNSSGCQGDECSLPALESDITVRFAPGDDGGLRIVEVVTSIFHGCGC